LGGEQNISRHQQGPPYVSSRSSLQAEVILNERYAPARGARPRGLGFAPCTSVTVLPPLPLSWQELARRTYQKATEDNFLDLAAQLSYYFFLALFPAILFLLALASFFPLQNLTDNLGSTLGTVVSPEVSLFKWTWLIVQWPLVFAMVTTAIGLVYYFGPDAEQDWAWVSPGALVGTTLWLLVSLAFKVYIANFTDYNASYGAVGGVIVMLLWFYISGIALILGAEMNAAIEQASPYGKAPGQKSPAGKRLLGARAARAFAQQQPAPEPSPAFGVAVPAEPAHHPRSD
jgi:uncharacterized BrkB/YihY/UPF0761 family membrane protein